jgi:uncharacterized membrane protein HdeD (DUF308 family)
LTSQNIVRIAWIIAMIAGVVLIIIGYRKTQVMCNLCPMQTEGQPSTCQCDGTKANSDFLVAYAGIAVVLGGVATAVIDFSGRLHRAQVELD